MDILLTGASSFTGYWFAKALAEAGHRVVAPLKGRVADYTQGMRAVRVQRLAEVAEIVEACAFGSPAFLALCDVQKFEVLCHHAARVTDYKSPDFDVARAVAENTLALPEVLARLKRQGARAVALTGSVFEAGEGEGTQPLIAFSPYGVSKGKTADLVRQGCEDAGLAFHKFVIANPFGPLEEERFCAFLMHQWKAGAVATVTMPDYVRDNIHVGLLAKAYAKYVGEAAAGTAAAKINPSGYVEAQGVFAERYAHEIRARSALACALTIAKQTLFAEPLVRFNTDSAAAYVGDWNEAAAWDAIAESYGVVQKSGTLPN